MTPASYPGPGPLGATDPERWRLSSATDGGRHVWHYARNHGELDAEQYEAVWGQDTEQTREREQNDETRYWLGLDLEHPDDVDPKPAQTPFGAAQKGERERAR